MYRKNLRWHPILRITAVPGRSLLLSRRMMKSSSFLSLQTVQMLFRAWGSMVSHLWQGCELQRLPWPKRMTAADALSVSIGRQGSWYAARILDNVTIAKSTMVAKPPHEWRYPSINNVVDVTNYILLLWSTYACLWLGYLWRKISVCVKRVQVKVVTLDGEECELETSDLVITVADKAVAPCRCHGEATEISEKSSCRPWSGCLQWQIDP